MKHRYLSYLLIMVALAITLTMSVAPIFGHAVVSNNGTSMVPTFNDGDGLWVKQLDLAEVKVGDVLVAIQRPGSKPVDHRVVSIDLRRGGYRIATKGDGNGYTEIWEAELGQTVGIVKGHVPFAGYLVRFAHTMIGRVVLVAILAILVLVLILMRRWSATRIAKQSKTGSSGLLPSSDPAQ